MSEHDNGDRCSGCGSEQLWSCFYDPDSDSAVIVDAHREQPNIRWTTFCASCGNEQ